jgi:hypothetical protein
MYVVLGYASMLSVCCYAIDRFLSHEHCTVILRFFMPLGCALFCTHESTTILYMFYINYSLMHVVLPASRFE